MITPVKLTRSRSASEDIVLYSDAVAAVEDINIIYVDQLNGNDINSGKSSDKAVQTLEKAASLLKTREEGGTGCTTLFRSSRTPSADYIDTKLYL